MLRQLYHLPFFDKLVFGKAFILIVFVKVLLKFVRYRTIVGLIDRFSARKPHHTESVEVERFHKLIKLIYGFTFFNNNCLPVSLSFLYLLRRKGIQVQLKFGYKTEHGKMLAHAWLEYHHVPLSVNPDIAKEYSPFNAPLIDNI